MPKVTVIIPNYNHASYLERRIDSVINQSYQDFELIILDDCSTDKSREIIEQYRHHLKLSHIIYNENNSGTTFKQWQKGIELALGEYIWIAESDDFCYDSFLEKAVKALDSNVNASLFYCQSNCVDAANKVLGDMHWWTDSIKGFDWKKYFTADGNEFAGKVLTQKNVIVNASGVLMRKKSIQTHITKIVNYKKCGDWLFWALLLKDNQLIYCPEKLNFFRTHDQTTRVNLTAQQRICRVVEGISVRQQIQGIVEYQQMNELGSKWNDILSVASFSQYNYLNSLIRLLPVRVPKFYKAKFLYYSLKRFVFRLLKRIIFPGFCVAV